MQEGLVPLLDGTTSGGGDRDKNMETSLAGTRTQAEAERETKR